jgi:hypothetical protein
MSPVEKLICSNRQLSDMDGYMGELYAQLRQVDPNRAALARQQVSWLKSRDRECPPERPVKRPAFACVAKRLEIRIDQFQARLQALGESDMEGPEENDTGPRERIATSRQPPPQPKSKPAIAVQAEVALKSEPPAAPEAQAPQVTESAESKKQEAKQPEVKPAAPGDEIDRNIKDAYRRYVLIKACDTFGITNNGVNIAKVTMK